MEIEIADYYYYYDVCVYIAVDVDVDIVMSIKASKLNFIACSCPLYELDFILVNSYN